MASERKPRRRASVVIALHQFTMMMHSLEAFIAATVGTFLSKLAYQPTPWRRTTMDGIIYLVGLIVIIMFILSFFGLR